QARRALSRATGYPPRAPERSGARGVSRLGVFGVAHALEARHSATVNPDHLEEHRPGAHPQLARSRAVHDTLLARLAVAGDVDEVIDAALEVPVAPAQVRRGIRGESRGVDAAHAVTSAMPTNRLPMPSTSWR